MTERPILFSGPMVRAILDGTKTQTRRVIKPQPIWEAHDGHLAFDDVYNRGIRCPYGAPGDRLWVRETWGVSGQSLRPLRDGPVIAYRATDDRRITWKPSIHMPRAYARIFLDIVGVRVERVQDISEADAMAEGIKRYIPNYKSEPVVPVYGVEYSDDRRGWPTTARDAFAALWDSINAKRGHPWESNPWVRVVEFRRVA